MKIDVSVDPVRIDQPAKLVADFAFDPANDPRWIGGVSEARQRGAGPLKVGTQIDRVASFMGRRIEYVLEVSELDHPLRLVMTSVQGPFPMTVAYRLIPSGDDACDATIGVQGQPGGFYQIAAPVMEAIVRRNVGNDLRRLKAIIEDL